MRANLRRKDEAYSELVWGRYTKPWTDVDPAHTDGSDMDQHLSTCLLSVKIPDWAAPLVRNPLTQWHAILAVQAVCRQVFLRTDLSDKQPKKRVRDPDPESRVGGRELPDIGSTSPSSMGLIITIPMLREIAQILSVRAEHALLTLHA